MREVRCPNCKKMLFQADVGTVEIKCNKCKYTWFIVIPTDRKKNIITRVSRTPDR